MTRRTRDHLGMALFLGGAMLICSQRIGLLPVGMVCVAVGVILLAV